MEEHSWSEPVVELAHLESRFGSFHKAEHIARLHIRRGKLKHERSRQFVWLSGVWAELLDECFGFRGIFRPSNQREYLNFETARQSATTKRQAFGEPRILVMWAYQNSVQSISVTNSLF